MRSLSVIPGTEVTKCISAAPIRFSLLSVRIHISEKYIKVAMPLPYLKWSSLKFLPIVQVIFWNFLILLSAPLFYKHEAVYPK